MIKETLVIELRDVAVQPVISLDVQNKREIAEGVVIVVGGRSLTLTVVQADDLRKLLEGVL